MHVIDPTFFPSSAFATASRISSSVVVSYANSTMRTPGKAAAYMAGLFLTRLERRRRRRSSAREELKERGAWEEAGAEPPGEVIVIKGPLDCRFKRTSDSADN